MNSIILGPPRVDVDTAAAGEFGERGMLQPAETIRIPTATMSACAGKVREAWL
jgi:hypothetical protein